MPIDLDRVQAVQPRDANVEQRLGHAEFCTPVPEQWLRYRDMALDSRAAEVPEGAIGISDLDRVIAWGFALAAEPMATAPVPDETVRAHGYPTYPVLGYTRPDLLGPISGGDNRDPEIVDTGSMTFRYGSSDPLGGSGWLQGQFYLRKIARTAC